VRTKKYKHTVGTRLYWRIIQRRWRAENPERAREIRRRYFRKKRTHLTSIRKGGKKMKKKSDADMEVKVVIRK
jgi:hypothetical protein